MHRLVQVTHSLFIEGSHKTKNMAFRITTLGIIKVSIMILNVQTCGIVILSIMTLSIKMKVLQLTPLC
jgi:hypothetical protein